MKIGPFTIHERIGSGAMGEVWRATHESEGFPVALKIITPSYASRESYRRRFYNEIRSAAALHHPGIVEVYDYGTVDEPGGPDSKLDVPAGAPYFAMELTPGGSLADLDPEITWHELRSLLIDLLRALGHAHARGVVHRDLKPSNVLLGDSENGRRFKISDFGLAFDRERAVADELDENGTVGTPPYMAPEQFRNRWRDYGPWTDLYGLGCLAWRLATGRPPYSNERLYEVAKEHISSPLPEFEPLFEVPSGFESWLARLLQKNPLERFKRAADALWVLLRMPETMGGAPAAPDVREAFDSEPSTNETAPLEPLAKAGVDGPRHDGEMPQVPEDYDVSIGPHPSDSVEPTRRAPPPLPETWTQRRPPALETPRMSVGLELFTLREFPTVGRETERDILWNALKDVVDEQASRAIFLRGDAGVGKTRLGRWLRERAEELGAAAGHMAPHSRRETTGGGLPSMLAKAFGVAGMSRVGALERIERWYRARGVDRPYEWHAMTELVAADPGVDRPDSDSRLVEPTAPILDRGDGDRERPSAADSPDVRSTVDADAAARTGLTNAHEIRALVRRFLEYAARERPQVVHLDDLHWGLETLHFLKSFFESPQTTQVPVLFVGTVREDALAERPLEGRLVEELLERETIESVEIGPMPETDQRLLVEELLHLAPPAARTVVEHSAGNPLYAVELVRDWVDRSLLEPSPRGFRLQEGADPAIPENLYEVWRGRLDEITEGESGEIIVGLQLGATLGLEIDEAEWRDACDRADVPFPIRSIEALLRRNLLRETDSGWRFAHNMLRHSLVRRAREAGRWTRLNKICADVVADRPDTDDERLAQFLMAAGRRREAFEPLLDAAEDYDLRIQHDEAQRLFEAAGGCSDEVDLEDRPELEAKYELRRGRVEFTARRDPDAAEEAFRRAARLAEAIGDDSRRARALVERSSVAVQRHDYEQATDLAREARSLLPDDEVSLAGVRAAFHLAESLHRAGDPAGADEEFERAHDMARGRFPAERLKCLLRWADLDKNAGHHAAARRKAEEALHLSERLSSHETQARVYNLLGDVARLQESPDEARDFYERAEELAVLVADPALYPVFMGRVQLALEEDEYEHAARLLQRVRDRTRRERHSWFTVALLSLEIQAAAGSDDWTTVREDYEALQSELQGDAPAIPGAASSLRESALLAAEVDRREFARRLARTSQRIWPESSHEELERELQERGVDFNPTR